MVSAITTIRVGLTGFRHSMGLNLDDVVAGVKDQLLHPFPHKIADDLFSIAHAGGWSDSKNGKKSGHTGCSPTNPSVCTQSEIAGAIGLAESNGEVDAQHTNSDGSIDRGWLQVNSVHKQYDPKKLLSNPVYTAKAGHDIYLTQGWRAWSTYKSGAYLSHLGQNKTISLGNATGVDAVVQQADQAANWTDLLSKLLATIGTRDFWLRTGKIIIGGVLVIVAVLLFANEYLGKYTPAGKIAGAMS